MQLFTLRPFNQDDNASLYKDANEKKRKKPQLSWKHELALYTCALVDFMHKNHLWMEIRSSWHAQGPTWSHPSASLCKVSSLNISLITVQ